MLEAFLITKKDIDSILSLLSCAQTDGNYIMESWVQVQRCVSCLDRLHVYGGAPATMEDSRYLSFAWLIPPATN